MTTCVLVAALAAASRPLADGSAVLLPSSSIDGSAVLGHLSALLAVGTHRRTGTDEERKAGAYISGVLGRAGLTAQAEVFETPVYTVRSHALRLGDRDLSAQTWPLWFSGRTAAGGIAGDVVLAAPAAADPFAGQSVRGAIIVATFPRLYGNRAQGVRAFYARAQTAGAAALLIGFDDWFDDVLVAFNTPDYAPDMRLPALFVTGRGIAALRAAPSGSRVHFTLDATVASRHVTNVWAVLPGKSPEVVFVNAPYTSWFRCGIERAGAATALHLAEQFGRLPLEQRPFTLVFSFTTGHELGHLGIRYFIDHHSPDVTSRARVFLNLGAGVAGLRIDRDAGRVRVSTEPEPRAAVLADQPALIAMAEEELRAAGVGYQLTTSSPRPGESAEVERLGLPSFALLSAGLLFHTPQDTLDLVREADVAVAARIYARLIERVGELPARSPAR